MDDQDNSLRLLTKLFIAVCSIWLCSASFYWILGRWRTWWRTRQARKFVKQSFSDEYDSLVDMRQLTVREYLRAKMEGSNELGKLELKIFNLDMELMRMRQTCSLISKVANPELLLLLTGRRPSLLEKDFTVYNDKKRATNFNAMAESAIIEEVNNDYRDSLPSSSGESLDMELLGNN